MLLSIARLRAVFTGIQPPRYSRLPNGEKDEGPAYAIPRRLAQTLFALTTLALLALLSLLLPAHNPFHHAIDHRNATKHLVVASYTAQNVSWLAQIPASWTVKRYLMDDPDPAYPALAVPFNQGREAMAYLTYIIDHYDDLPDYMVFVHGHERSWHQMMPLWMKVRALNLTALDEENYISLRCGAQMGCEKLPYIDTRHPNWGGEDHMRDFWKEITGEKCPRYISYKCCAQHAVTRRAVRGRTRQQWERIREPIMKVQGDSWLGGMYYEKFWHLLLGAGPEYCPSSERCQQVHFSNAIICDGETDATVFEGDAWRDVRCVSAFDGWDKEGGKGTEEEAVRRWHGELLNTYARVRKEAGARHRLQQEAYARQQVDGL
ncbi:hypothetical protein LTR53_011168 [Teratosphaeriaceae sp. CCFEE 6253]|nr:hypothetical protein LTR53_011168 [Teratosphaeriaceae sp. CCFEE 6253]